VTFKSRNSVISRSHEMRFQLVSKLEEKRKHYTRLLLNNEI